jgi:hypothetical protein
MTFFCVWLKIFQKILESEAGEMCSYLYSTSLVTRDSIQNVRVLEDCMKTYGGTEV